MSLKEQKPVRVAVGIIYSGNKILCCQRKREARYGLHWEFPGGKVQENESPEKCLSRELNEELGITPIQLAPYGQYIQRYTDNGVFEVNYYFVSQFSGSIQNRVFESIRWLEPGELDSIPFLDGNKKVIKQLMEEFPG